MTGDPHRHRLADRLTRAAAAILVCAATPALIILSLALTLTDPGAATIALIAAAVIAFLAAPVAFPRKDQP